MNRMCIAFLLIAGPSLAATYTPTEAGSHKGETATVEGVASVYISKSGVTFVDLGGHGRDAPFTGVIFKDKAASIPNVELYNGKSVEITGPIKIYQGKPEIIINESSQIKIK